MLTTRTSTTATTTPITSRAKARTRPRKGFSVVLALTVFATILGFSATASAQSVRYELVEDEGDYLYVIDNEQNTRLWADHCSNLGTSRSVDWDFLKEFVEIPWTPCDELEAILDSNPDSDRYELVVDDSQKLYLLDYQQSTRTWADHCNYLDASRVTDWDSIKALDTGTWSTCDEIEDRLGATSSAPAFTLPTAGANFDYQIGGDYTPASGVEVVSRDWNIGSSEDDLYSICYVNAYQTQPNPDSPAVSGERADLDRQWRASDIANLRVETVEDENWPGEFLINISTPERREAAALYMDQILVACSEGGFDAIEFDNLDSWTRSDLVPNNEKWDVTDAAEYAKLLVERTNELGLAAAQKNTTDFFEYSNELGKTPAEHAGFDFVVSENCGRYNECQRFTDNSAGPVFNIEYPCPTSRELTDMINDGETLSSGEFGVCSTNPNSVNLDAGVEVACNANGPISVVIRDVNVTPRGSDSGEHLNRTCGN